MIMNTERYIPHRAVGNNNPKYPRLPRNPPEFYGAGGGI